MKTFIYGACVTALALLFFISTNTRSANACSIVSQTPQELFDRAGVVFFGRVSSVATSSQGDLQNVEAVVSVSTSWKQRTNLTVKIKSSGIYTCGPAFGPNAQGSEYLIYAATSTEAGTYGVIRMGPAESNSPEVTALGKGYEILTQMPSATYYQFNKNLTLGSDGYDVILLQTWLEDNGFLKIPAGVKKGYFGQMTRAALIKYQISKGIVPAVGYFGPLTRATLKNAVLVPLI